MKKFSKRTDYKIAFEIVKPGEKIYNFLEDSTAVTDEEHCVVLTGTVGEKWPITIAQLHKKYDTSAYSEFKLGDTGYVNPRPDGGYIWAEPAESECIVKTSWGVELHAAAGDYIVCADKDGEPDESDRWVINKMIFPNTYKEEK